VLGAFAALLLSGAEGGGCKADREVPVEVVRAAPACGGEREGVSVRRLASAEELRAALPLETRLGGSEGAGSEAAAPDFSREVVLLVAMGQQRTAGYAIELARPVALVKGSVAGLQVILRSPEPGSVTAQVLTSPCLVVKLAKEGLDEVKVAGEDRKVLAEVKLK
jgi:hypothetical protein